MTLKRGLIIGTPSSDVELASFDLTTTAASGTYPFTLGMGFAIGDADDVQVNLANAQVVVQRRWSDDSVKHAIISGRAALTEDVPLTVTVSSGTQSAGVALTASDIESAAPTASVAFDALSPSLGTVSLASLLASPFRTWISGPEMVECHYHAEVGGGTLLSVWFRVRLFADGRMWVRVRVENGWLDDGVGGLASVTTQTYIPTITVGGVVVYNNGGVAVSHYQRQSYLAEGWIGTDPQISLSHDVAYLRSTKLVPNYLTDTPSASALNGLYRSYEQLDHGTDIEGSMGAAGFQRAIGPLAIWDAMYVTSDGDSRAFDSVIANAKSFGVFPYSWRDKTTKLPPKPSDFPTWSSGGPGAGVDTSNHIAGARGYTWAHSHCPSIGFLAYLLTGDYDLYETMALNCALTYLGAGSVANGAGTARIVRQVPRGIAWNIRNLAQYVGIAPTGDAVAADYRTWLASQFAYWEDEVTKVGASQIGYPMVQGNAWMQHFWIGANGYAWDIETGLTGADLTTQEFIRDHQYKGVVGILGPNGAENYCFTEASANDLIVCDTPEDPDTPIEDMYQTWGEVFEESWGSPNTACTNTLGGASAGVPGEADIGRWGNLLPAIAYAVDHGAIGAQTAWNRLIGATNWSDLRNAGFSEIPIWGIVPRNWSD
jgi:hypothetical protein